MKRSHAPLLLLLVWLLAACAAQPSTPAAEAPTTEPEPSPTNPPRATATLFVRPSPTAEVLTCDLEGPLLLGAVESLSGPAELYGLSIRKGLELAVEEVNEQDFISPESELQLIVEDDGSDKDQAAAAFLKLMREDDVLGILGPTLSNSAFTAHPLAQAASVPVLATSNTAEGITTNKNYIFRNSLPEADVIPNTINAARDAMEIQSVAILYGDDDLFTQSGFEVMQRASEQQGLEVLGTERFAKGDTDFSAQLARIQELEPDAILVSALLDEAAGILTQAREMGIEVPIIGGNGFNSAQLIARAGIAAEGAISGAAWFIQNPSPENQAFIEAYRAKYESDPDQFAAQAYTGLWLFAHALRDACSMDRREIRDALSDLHLIKTPLGSFSFTSERDPLHPPVVLVVKDGAFTILNPEE